MEKWSSTFNLTTGWAVRFFMSKVNGGVDTLFTRLGVGSGDLVDAASNESWRTWEDGYGVLFGRAGESNSRLWETASGAESTLGSNFTVASFNGDTYELRYAANTLALYRNGTLLRTVSDSTYAATAKDVCITQGERSAGGGAGAVSTWGPVLARPYDGVDPAITVGAETPT